MRCLWLLVVMLTAGCAGQRASTVNDSGNDAFAAAIGDAIVLAADRPGLSHVGKDYLVAGPMTVNLGGSSQRRLYLASGSTIDRRITGADEPPVENVVFDVDGALMSFDLEPWRQDRDALPYDPSLLARRDYTARVTRSQLRALADANTLSAWVTDKNGRSPTYQLVRGETADLMAGPGTIR